MKYLVTYGGGTPYISGEVTVEAYSRDDALFQAGSELAAVAPKFLAMDVPEDMMERIRTSTHVEDVVAV